MEFEALREGIVSSLIASVIFTGLGAISLKYWKNVALGVGALAFISVSGAAVIWGVQSAIERYEENRKVVHVQDRLDRFLKGNYKSEYDLGWRVEVHKVKPRLMLAFVYPDDVVISKSYHPFYDIFTRAAISEMLKNEGYSREPQWLFRLRPLSEEEFLQQLEAQG